MGIHGLRAGHDGDRDRCDLPLGPTLPRFRLSVIVVLLVLVFPGFARQSAGFMTDGPAYALMMVACCWDEVASGRRRAGELSWPRSVSASSASASASSRSRHRSAILTVAWARSQEPEERNWLTVLTTALSLATGVVGVITFASIPVAMPSRCRRIPHSLGSLGPAFITLAALVFPAALLAMGPRIAAFDPRVLLVSAGLVGLMVSLSLNGPLLGNLWTSNGLGGGYLESGGYYDAGFGDFFLTGSRTSLFGMTGWNFSEQLATFAAFLVAALVLRWGQRSFSGVASFSTARAIAMQIMRGPEAPLLLFLLLYASAVVVYSAVAPVYDRYLYPMVPVASILLLRRASQTAVLGRGRAFAHSAFAWLAVSAFIIAANSFAYDTARHAEGEVAVAMGYDPGTVDAGYEWVGSHGVGPEKRNSNPLDVNWWEDNWPTFRPCAVLSNSLVDIADYKLIRVNPAAYKQFLFFGPDEPLLLYGAVMDGCPAPPST